MGNFVFWLTGFSRKTGRHVQILGKVKGTVEEVMREMAERENRFRKTHRYAYAAGPVDMLDEDFFNSLTDGEDLERKRRFTKDPDQSSLDEVREAVKDLPGETIVTSTSSVDVDFFDALMRFQYGDAEESDRAFEEIKERSKKDST